MRKFALPKLTGATWPAKVGGKYSKVAVGFMAIFFLLDSEYLTANIFRRLLRG